MVGPKGKRLQIIMLDTRFFRSPLVQIKKNGRKTYLPKTGPDTTMLGEAQWKWLANELRKPAELRLIVSSIQVIATDHRFEKWANLPDERQRLFELLGTPGVGPVLLLSGDRHCAEVARLPAGEVGLPFDLYELTSSGMTHAGAPDDPSPTRVKGTFTRSKNYGLIEIDWEKSKPSLRLKIMSSKGTPLSTTEVTF
jgi:alkaline phosphatase D